MLGGRWCCPRSWLGPSGGEGRHDRRRARGDRGARRRWRSGVGVSMSAHLHPLPWTAVTVLVVIQVGAELGVATTITALVSLVAGGAVFRTMLRRWSSAPASMM